MFQKHGAKVHQEFPVVLGNQTLFVDLLIWYCQDKIVCEAELSADRVCTDVEKAAALDATLLLIVVPQSRVAKSARRRIQRSRNLIVPQDMGISILPLGPALQWVTKKVI